MTEGFDMTRPPMEDGDAFAELWQGGGEVRIAPIVPGVDARLGSLRSANRMNWWITVIALVLIIAVEAATGFANGLWLSGLTLAITVGTWFWYRLREGQLVEAYAGASEAILPFLIRRTRGTRDFWALTAVSPFLAIAGVLAWERFMGTLGRTGEVAMTPWLAGLLVLMVALAFAVEVYAIWVTLKATRELRVLRAMSREG